MCGNIFKVNHRFFCFVLSAGALACGANRSADVARGPAAIHCELPVIGGGLRYFEPNRGMQVPFDYPVKGARFYAFDRKQNHRAFRAFESEGAPSFVLRLYSGPRAADELKNDAKAFEILRTLGSIMKIPKPRPGKIPNSLEIDDSLGETVQNIVTKKLLQNPAFNYVIDRYNSALSELKIQIYSSYNIHCALELDGVLRSLSCLIPTDKSDIRIRIAPDQVIVDSRTLELSLADPF